MKIDQSLQMKAEQVRVNETVSGNERRESEIKFFGPQGIVNIVIISQHCRYIKFYIWSIMLE